MVTRNPETSESYKVGGLGTSGSLPSDYESVVARFALLRASVFVVAYAIAYVFASRLIRFALLTAIGRSGKLTSLWQIGWPSSGWFWQVPHKETVINAPDIAVGAVIGLASLAFLTCCATAFEGHLRWFIGLGKRQFSGFFIGAMTGLISMSLLVSFLDFMGYINLSLRADGVQSLLYGCLWLMVYFAVGTLEECLFHCYPQYALTRGLRAFGSLISTRYARQVAFWIAATLLSTAFAAAHLRNPGESLIGIVSVFVLGMVSSYGLWRTGSLWWSVGFHSLWDWTQSFLLGVPDSGALSAGRLVQTASHGPAYLSGASVGPEGSLLTIPALLLAVLLVRWTTQSRIGERESAQLLSDVGL
jgi:membrane protease YdiL (CAAX protease family)